MTWDDIDYFEQEEQEEEPPQEFDDCTYVRDTPLAWCIERPSDDPDWVLRAWIAKRISTWTPELCHMMVEHWADVKWELISNKIQEEQDVLPDTGGPDIEEPPF